MSMKKSVQQDQVDRNYKAFKKLLPRLLKSDKNRFALLHDEKLIACFDTRRDANQAATKLMAGKPYSVQQITDTTVDLGYISYASA